MMNGMLYEFIESYAGLLFFAPFVAAFIVVVFALLKNGSDTDGETDVNELSWHLFDLNPTTGARMVQSGVTDVFGTPYGAAPRDMFDDF